MGFKIKELFGTADTENAAENSYYSISTEDALRSVDGEGSKLILLEPRAYSESQQIADHLKNRNSVVVNLKRVTSDQAKRIIDFLSGCIYAIGGTMQKIGVGIYLCTPKNVNVQGKISEDNKEEKKITLLDVNGNTSLPGDLTVNGTNVLAKITEMEAILKNHYDALLILCQKHGMVDSNTGDGSNVTPK